MTKKIKANIQLSHTITTIVGETIDVNLMLCECQYACNDYYSK